VVWLKDGTIVEEGERFRLLKEANFFCVDVAPVTLEDTGRWSCLAKNIHGHATCSCNLSVLVPKAYKKPEFVEELKALLTSQGTVSLECKVVGVPTPTLKWFKDDREIRAGDVFALRADPDDPTSLGTYTCQAVNCMGRALSTSRVHVLAQENSPNLADSILPPGPVPQFSKELRNEKVKIGGSLKLDCRVQVPPWPKAINWYNKEGEVKEGGRYHIMEDGLGGYSLAIEPLHAADDGLWKCVATSNTGVKAYTTCQVQMAYPRNYRKPKFLESLKAILTEEGLVSFECKVVGYPTPNLTWFKDGQELKPGDVYQLTGTNSLGSYCCIAKNCMGDASSTAELTIEDIQSQLSEQERMQLFSGCHPPRFIQGLKSMEAKINEKLRFTIQVSVSPEPSVLWFRDDEQIEESNKFHIEKELLGIYHLNITKLEFCDQAEWKCVATNEYGQSVTSCFLKLNIPKHYKKPKFLENLRAVLSDEGAVNLECKVIGVPQPVLKWYKDGKELKPGDIHRIISGQDGTCCLGTYTCEAHNCMGTASSSASLLGFEGKVKKEKVEKTETKPPHIPLARNPSLSTIHEERTSQLHDTERSLTIDDRADEISFSFDGKEVSVSLYETPDLTEEEALQIVEMYADQISEHVSEHNIVDLPPMRFTKESSTSGNLMMEAVVIDVSQDYFSAAEDDLRTDADLEEFSVFEDPAGPSPDDEGVLDKLLERSLDPLAKVFGDDLDLPPVKPPRRKSDGNKANNKAGDKTPRKLAVRRKSSDSEKEDDSLKEFEKRKYLKSMQKVNNSKNKERKRTDSEMEDDSLYEFENRKSYPSERGPDEDAPKSPATKLAERPESGLSGSTGSDLGIAGESPRMADDEDKSGEFDTAEAFDRSDVSVLESLTQSLQEIEKGLARVEAQVLTESAQELLTAKSSISVIESLVLPISEIKRGLESVEQLRTNQSIMETVVQPLQDFNREIALIQQHTIMESESCRQEADKAATQRDNYTRSRTQEETLQCQAPALAIEDKGLSTSGQEKITPEKKTLLKSLSVELRELEENAIDDLSECHEKLMDFGKILREKIADETDLEIATILKSVGDYLGPLKRLTNVTSKCISVIVEDYEAMGLGSGVPSSALMESLTKPLEGLKNCLQILEEVTSCKAHKEIRGIGIPILYKLTAPMDELETTIKLVENLSAHTAMEFLSSPLKKLNKAIDSIDLKNVNRGFVENLIEGVEIIKDLDKSVEIMMNCINSIDRYMPQIEIPTGNITKLSTLIKPLEEFQRHLQSLEEAVSLKMRDPSSCDNIYQMALDINKPLELMRMELSILQHQIEADHFGEISLGRQVSHLSVAMFTLTGSLENVQSSISTFYESIKRKPPQEPVHLRYVLYSLRELTLPLNQLCSTVMKAEGAIIPGSLGVDPFVGLKAVNSTLRHLNECNKSIKSERVDCCGELAKYVSILCGYIDSTEKIPAFETVEQISHSPASLVKTLEEPVREISRSVAQMQHILLSEDEGRIKGEILAIAEPVRELKRNIAVICQQANATNHRELSSLSSPSQNCKTDVSPLLELKEAVDCLVRSQIIGQKRLLTSESLPELVAIANPVLKVRDHLSMIDEAQHSGSTLPELSDKYEEIATHINAIKKELTNIEKTDTLSANADKLIVLSIVQPLIDACKRIEIVMQENDMRGLESTENSTTPAYPSVSAAENAVETHKTAGQTSELYEESQNFTKDDACKKKFPKLEDIISIGPDLVKLEFKEIGVEFKDAIQIDSPPKDKVDKNDVYKAKDLKIASITNEDIKLDQLSSLLSKENQTKINIEIASKLNSTQEHVSVQHEISSTYIAPDNKANAGVTPVEELNTPFIYTHDVKTDQSEINKLDKNEIELGNDEKVTKQNENKEKETTLRGQNKEMKLDTLGKNEDEKISMSEAESVLEEGKHKSKGEEDKLERKIEEEKEREEKEAERLTKEGEENLKGEVLAKEQEEVETGGLKEEAKKLKKEYAEKERDDKEAERVRQEEEKLKKENEEKERQEKEVEKQMKQDKEALIKKKEEQEREAKELKEIKEKERKDREEKEAEQLRKEEEKKLKKEKKEALRKEKEAERLRKDGEEKLKKEREEKEAKRLKQEEEERLKKENEEKSKKENEEKVAANLRKEEETKIMMEKKEKLRKEKEASRIKEEEEKLKKKKEEEKKQQEADKLKKEKEERERKEKEAEEQKKKEEERLKNEKEEKERKEKEAERLRKEEEEERLKKEDEEKERKENEAKKQKKEEEKLKKENEEKEMKDKEAEVLRKEKEKKLKKEKKEKLRKEKEAERIKQEETEKVNRDKEEQEKKQKEADKLKQEEEERLKKENEEKEKKNKEAEEQKKKEEILRIEKAEKEKKDKEAEEQKKKEEERLRIEKEEKEKKDKEAEEQKKKEEDRLRIEKEEKESKEKEAERLRKEEEERLKKENEEKERKENEAKRHKKEEEEKLKKENEEKEAEELRKEKEKKLKKEKKEKLKKEKEAERKKKEEQEKLKKDKEEQEKKQKEADKLKQEEEERLKKENEEKEKKNKEAEEQKKKEEILRIEKAEKEKKDKEAEEQKKKEEERLRIEKEEKEKKDKEAEEQKKKEEDRLRIDKEENEKKDKDAEEQKKKEEERLRIEKEEKGAEKIKGGEEEIKKDREEKENEKQRKEGKNKSKKEKKENVCKEKETERQKEGEEKLKKEADENDYEGLVKNDEKLTKDESVMKEKDEILKNEKEEEENRKHKKDEKLKKGIGKVKSKKEVIGSEQSGNGSIDVSQNKCENNEAELENSAMLEADKDISSECSQVNFEYSATCQIQAINDENMAGEETKKIGSLNSRSVSDSFRNKLEIIESGPLHINENEAFGNMSFNTITREDRAKKNFSELYNNNILHTPLLSKKNEYICGLSSQNETRHLSKRPYEVL
ncbi:hypothetical protein AAG570_012368, partial [Ranatra chinensis]